ncbi:XRE family transcriptional regulator [Loigolactobacillus backii]|uniref:XRE family transcriptional regulator n=1 Tax=Loigolactobacillus backii TaxID=375175 RepID=UPI0022FD9D07|nr:XRE family transcriptional regulator [Loigolactobacillus backii]MDA5386983.1 XRE family transcriptional regulator [Loigolactobacillus backii]MDA5389521.1 XRE family transcriptional regulator [Loigolactobacillus backii]
MPTTLSGRELIKNYLKNNNISITSLATTFGVGKMYMTQVLNGSKNSAAANELVLNIINTFKIRPREE